jgi:hypothetical protein
LFDLWSIIEAGGVFTPMQVATVPNAPRPLTFGLVGGFTTFSTLFTPPPTGAEVDVGFMCPVGLRETGGAHKLRIGSTTDDTTWRFERAAVWMQQTGRRRQC